MLRCLPVRIPIALVALALVVRAAVFGLHPDAAYPDSYYYVDVARALQSGHGFSIDFIWSFVDVGGRIPAHPMLPIPSNAHWMPLAAVIQLPTMWLLGPTPLASTLPFLLIGSLAAPLTWLLAKEIGCSPRIALAAGIAVAVPAATTIFMSQPDNMSLYQPLGTAALWLAARALKGNRRSYLLAGVAVGLATLARNDGVLLGAAVGLAFVWDRWHALRSKGSRLPAIPWRYAFACLGIFVLIMAPWYARQLAVFGSISPSSSSGRILLIQTYDQMNSVTSDTSLSGFLSQGIGPLLQSRLFGLFSAIQIYFMVATPVVIAPFVIIGAWGRRRAVEFGPFFTYAAILFSASGLLFAVHVPYGTLLHSAVALVPLTFILAFEGAVMASAWVARHRSSWTPEGAQRLFLIAAVASVLLNPGAFTALAFPSWKAAPDPPLSPAPPGFKYFTGRGGVVTPNDSLEIIHQVAIDYDIRWLVIERAHIVDPLAPVIEGKLRPAWIGAPIFTVAYIGKKTGDPAVDAAPALAIYPVCTTTSDTRCGAAGLSVRAAP